MYIVIERISFMNSILSESFVACLIEIASEFAYILSTITESSKTWAKSTAPAVAKVKNQTPKVAMKEKSKRPGRAQRLKYNRRFLTVASPLA